MEDLHIQHHNLPTATNRVLSTKRKTTIPTTDSQPKHSNTIETSKYTYTEIFESRAKRAYRKRQDLALSPFNHKLLDSFRAVPGKLIMRKIYQSLYRTVKNQLTTETGNHILNLKPTITSSHALSTLKPRNLL